MRQVSTEGIILKRINFSEADRILTVITPDYGQVSLLAKGVRKSKSKLAGGLEIFSVSEINYIDGKSDLKTIVSTRLKMYFKNIVSNVERTMVAYDFMKLVESFSKHTETKEYYNLLKNGLSSLNEDSLEFKITEVWFYMNILTINGSGINLEKPQNKPAFSEEDNYDFSYDDMCFYTSKTGQFTPNHIKFIKLVNKADKPKKLMLIEKSGELAELLQKITKQSATMHKA
jgi:DNA repair protein RecO (recombination protein O)